MENKVFKIQRWYRSIKKDYDIEICENYHITKVLKTKDYYACWECWRNWKYYNDNIYEDY